MISTLWKCFSNLRNPVDLECTHTYIAYMHTNYFKWPNFKLLNHCRRRLVRTLEGKERWNKYVFRRLQMQIHAYRQSVCMYLHLARNQPSDDGGSFFLNCGPIPVPSSLPSLFLPSHPFSLLFPSLPFPPLPFSLPLFSLPFPSP